MAPCHGAKRGGVHPPGRAWVCPQKSLDWVTYAHPELVYTLASPIRLSFPTTQPTASADTCILSGVCDFLRGKQKQTSEDRRPTAIAWRRRLRGLLLLHHPLRLDHSSVLRVSRADLPTLPHHQLTLFHTEFFLGLLPATTLQPLPFREERDRRLSVCPALGRARICG